VKKKPKGNPIFLTFYAQIVMSGSHSEICHSNSKARECNYKDSSLKVGSFSYAQVLDSMLDECEEKYGLRNAHPHPRHVYDEADGDAIANNDQSKGDNDSKLGSTSSYEKDKHNADLRLEEVTNLIKKYSESYRTVAKLLRDLQSERKNSKYAVCDGDEVNQVSSNRFQTGRLVFNETYQTMFISFIRY
jgi:hypothetical protein